MSHLREVKVSVVFLFNFNVLTKQSEKKIWENKSGINNLNKTFNLIWSNFETFLFRLKKAMSTEVLDETSQSDSAVSGKHTL